MLNKELVTYQNKLYWIYKKVKEHQIKEGFVQDVKNFWGCDIVVKHKFNNDDLLLFLVEIPELEIIE